jgi:hypothetical protein
LRNGHQSRKTILDRTAGTTKSELIARAKASNKAIEEGRVIGIEDLEKESENW